MGFLDFGDRAFRALSYALPPKLIEYYQRQLNFAGIRATAASYLGWVTLLSFISAPVCMTVLPRLFPLPEFAALVLGLILPHVIGLFYLFQHADARRLRLEKYLPDTLVLIASNLSTGQTIDQALVVVSQHVEAPINAELDLTVRDLVSGVPLDQALRLLAERNHSAILTNTIDLTLFGLRSGGRLADLLQDVANEIRQTQILQEEVESQITLYKMFLLMTIVLIMPLMLAVATNFLVLAKAFGDSFSSGFSGVALPQGSGGVAGQLLTKIQSEGIGGKISSGDLVAFSYAMIIVSSIVISALIGVIERGEVREGLHYLPFLLVTAVLLYYFANNFVNALMKELFAGLF